MILSFNEKYTPNKDFIENGNQKKMKFWNTKKFNGRYGGWTHIVGLDNDRKLNDEENDCVRKSNKRRDIQQAYA